MADITLPPGAPPAWELQGVRLIGLALLPAAGVLGLLTLLALRRR